jgi:protein-disulfide isomerase
VKASDYACPFCQRTEPTLEQLVKDYPGQVRVVYKDYVVHPQTATVPALAACAAQEQGKFLEFNKAIWDNAFGKDTSEAKMTELATNMKLNMDKFKADMNGDKCKQALANDQKILSAVGVTGTPAFFINGRFLSGARPIEQFKAISRSARTA